MNQWSSFTKKELDFEIFIQEQELENDVLKIWNKAKIKPELWYCNDVIESYFWVVAIIDENLIWYNDITENFQKTPFKTQGFIDQYKAQNKSLNDMIKEI